MIIKNYFFYSFLPHEIAQQSTKTWILTQNPHYHYKSGHKSRQTLLPARLAKTSTGQQRNHFGSC